MTSIQPSRREGGFTLLELLLVIGVAALLLIGGIARWRLVSDGNKATEGTRLLLTLRQEAATMAQQDGGVYDNIDYDSTTSTSTNVFVASNILRLNHKNPFGGNITIAVNGADNTQLDITFDGVSQAGCVKMFTAITNPSEIVSVAANGGTARLADNGGTNDITPTNAAADCSASTNTLVWTVK